MIRAPHAVRAVVRSAGRTVRLAGVVYALACAPALPLSAASPQRPPVPGRCPLQRPFLRDVCTSRAAGQASARRCSAAACTQPPLRVACCDSAAARPPRARQLLDAQALHGCVRRRGCRHPGTPCVCLLVRAARARPRCGRICRQTHIARESNLDAANRRKTPATP
jgi:hypothetical protein